MEFNLQIACTKAHHRRVNLASTAKYGNARAFFCQMFSGRRRRTGRNQALVRAASVLAAPRAPPMGGQTGAMKEVLQTKVRP
jgi:hypothetical protein